MLRILFIFFVFVVFPVACLPKSALTTAQLSDFVTYYHNDVIYTFGMAQSDAIAAEYTAYEMFNAIYRCPKCDARDCLGDNFKVRFTLTDRCPYPGTVDDAYWSIGPSNNMLLDRSIDLNALNFFKKAFPGFARDFIETEDPASMREHFWQVFGADIFSIDSEIAKHPEETLFWQLFQYAEDRIFPNKRPIFNVQYDAADGPVFQAFDTFRMQKVAENMAKHPRVPRANGNPKMLKIEDISTDIHYPLHQETAQAIHFNNVFAKFIDVINQSEPNVPPPLPTSTEKPKPMKLKALHTFENLQRKSLANPGWHRTEQSEVYFGLPKDVFPSNKSDFSSFWMKVSPELRLKPKIMELEDEIAMTCDLNHFQFKLTPHFHTLNIEPNSYITFNAERLHDQVQEFVIVRFLSLLWPTALHVMHETAVCSFECPEHGKIYITAGCVSKNFVCDFESAKSCDWYFTNSEQIKASEQQKSQKTLHFNATISNQPDVQAYGNQNTNTDGNFEVVVGMVSSAKSSSPNHYAYYSSRKHSKKVAMIVSPYYQHASPSCSVTFNYRIIGEHGAHLLVSTQLIPFNVISSEEISDLEAEDWITPTQRQTIPASDSMADSQQVIVQIGEILQPTRIRIECHAKGGASSGIGNGMNTDLNVECMVDDIRLENCNENIWQPNLCSMDTQPKRYLCHQYKDQKCVDYADICDMHQDCPGREDEDPKLHNCKLAPSSARCTFEETRYEAGCENWIIVNMPNSVELIKLASVATPTDSPQTFRSTSTKMPLDKTNNQPNVGHYLMFSTFGHEHAVNSKFASDKSGRSGNTGGILYSHAMTPIYPRMDPRMSEPSSKLFGTCMMRFFFCHVGSTNFQIILERIKTHQKQVIWTPPRASLIEPCVWEKAAVALDYQSSEYFLKFGIAKMNNHKAMFLMDDFSMTPNCFLMKGSLLESTLPSSITLTSCSLSGAIPPDSKQCETIGSRNSRIDGEIAISGRRSFMVDKKVEYRIELYGAAGGLLPSRGRSENFGSMVILNHVFDMADEVTFVVGQTGETPCQTRTTTKKGQEITEILCSPGTRAKSRLLDFDPLDVPGTAGGGASALFVNGQALAIASGGAGIFPEEFVDPKSIHSFKSDTFFDYIPASKAFRSKRAIEDSIWSAGPGGAYNASNNRYPPEDCPDCSIMRGQLLSASNAKPGGCPTGRPWTLLGGFGGGGAACGPGGGGGAGFNGGAPGHKSPGTPGTSAVFAPVQKFISKMGINDGNGKIVLRACTMPCVINATCRFEDPVDGQIPREYCECSNGIRVIGSDSCASGIQSVVGRVKNTIDATHPRTLLSLILVLLLMMLCPCLLFILFRIYSTRRKTKAFKNFHNELQLIATDPLGMGNGAGAIVTRGSISSNGRLNLITGNPLYQYTSLQQVPYVNRDWCEFHDVIGHGAFGEVQSGTMTSPGGEPFRVAIKTLPVESNPEVISDFQTEARILSNFNHPNIVRFYGVCFDSLPKFIVLELLEGGDLKNYLRECRPRGLQLAGSSSIPTSPATHTPPSSTYTLMMSDLVGMALDVAKGCEYLECNKFVHRDIAARNCLLTSKNPLMRIVKIADFGMARDIYSNDYYRKGGRAFLPVKWMPPEAFLDGIFTSKTDTWAFGILLWELFSIGFTPYTGRQNQEVMQLIVNGGRLDPPIGTPDEIYKFMIRCWETSAELRPSFTQIVAFLNAALKLNDVIDAPLPPIVHKMSKKKSSTPPSIRSSAPPGDNDLGTNSQATINTMVTSMTESTTTSSYDSMPTKGEGVTHNLCPPYETRLARPIISMVPPLERVASGDESMSSHDESTLHDTCSVKQSPYAIGTIGPTGETMSSLQKDHPSGASLRSQGGAPPGSIGGVPFHKRLFRKSFERPKTGPNQPLISSTTSSSSSTTGGGGRGESASPAATGPTPAKRNDNQSPPLPSQLL